MNYLCNCDPCACADKSADRAAPSANEGVHRPSDRPSATDGPAGGRSRKTRGSVRRRAATCQQAGEASEPPVGAHLITPRRGYTHHGIYIGHGLVLHYAGMARNFQRGPVEEISLERFANDRPIYIECRSASALAAEDIVDRARSRLGEDRYRLLTNNCEHFAEWSRFGTVRSHQVERWLGPAPVMTRAVATSIGRWLARFRPEGRMHAIA
jgi:Lecithin retinol acyltransferase